MEPTELRAAARDGLATAAERFIRLLETQPHTATPIPGSRWTVRDAAAHLAGGLRRHIDYVHGEGTLAPTLDKEHFSNRTRSQLDETSEADSENLAGQIRNGVADYHALTASTPADQPIAYHGGLRPTLAQLTAVLLGEYVLHGYDVAVALGEPWPIEPEHAALVVGAYRLFLPLIFQPDAADGLQATFHVAVSGTDPYFVRIAHGAYEELDAAPPAVDCSIATDAVTALLVQSGRLSQWPAIALGRLTFSGARSEVGPRFASLFLFP